jgi:hypothetical protein
LTHHKKAIKKGDYFGHLFYLCSLKTHFASSEIKKAREEKEVPKALYCRFLLHKFRFCPFFPPKNPILKKSYQHPPKKQRKPLLVAGFLRFFARPLYLSSFEKYTVSAREKTD